MPSWRRRGPHRNPALAWPRLRCLGARHLALAGAGQPPLRRLSSAHEGSPASPSAGCFTSSSSPVPRSTASSPSVADLLRDRRVLHVPRRWRSRGTRVWSLGAAVIGSGQRRASPQDRLSSASAGTERSSCSSLRPPTFPDPPAPRLRHVGDRRHCMATTFLWGRALLGSRSRSSTRCCSRSRFRPRSSRSRARLPDRRRVARYRSSWALGSMTRTRYG